MPAPPNTLFAAHESGWRKRSWKTCARRQERRPRRLRGQWRCQCPLCYGEGRWGGIRHTVRIRGVKQINKQTNKQTNKQRTVAVGQIGESAAPETLYASFGGKRCHGVHDDFGAAGANDLRTVVVRLERQIHQRTAAVLLRVDVLWERPHRNQHRTNAAVNGDLRPQLVRFGRFFPQVVASPPLHACPGRVFAHGGDDGV